MSTPDVVSEPPDPQIERARARVGMVLQDKWTVDSLIGVGGMAAVYAATHRNGKRVAVKMLHAEVSHDEGVKQRFLQEGYAANTIQHEGAVSVLDDDVAPDGSAFIVMELLEGETVEQRWYRMGQRLPVGEVLAIVEQLLDVLAAAHAKNVVHRDIKPENLFITRSGQLKVLDFGIARVFEAQRGREATATRFGVVMGTPAFMAPEQARGRWDEVDGRTDLWAVGATMFMLLTGRFVHVGESGNDQLILSATKSAPPVASVEASVPPAVAAIIDKALEFERDQRWPDAASMLAAVNEVVGAFGRPELAAASSQRRAASSTVLGAGGPKTPVTPAGAAATVINATGTASAVTAWTKEREARAAETQKIRASIAELQQRFATAKKRVGEAQAKVEAGRTERSSLEQWFKRQVGTRTAAVEEARKGVRVHMVALARKAIADHEAFGAEMAAPREQVDKLDRAATSAQRDVAVYQAALAAYDVRSLRLGVLLLGVAAALVVALAVAPIVWRATRVIEPPRPVPIQQPAPAAPPVPS
jgi:serine/threonine-protein kinase